MRTLGLSKAHGIMEREESEKRELYSVHATSWKEENLQHPCSQLGCNGRFMSEY